jgi:hypothetical protein
VTAMMGARHVGVASRREETEVAEIPIGIGKEDNLQSNFAAL